MVDPAQNQDTESRQELETQVKTISEELGVSEQEATGEVRTLTEEQRQAIYARRGELATQLEDLKGQVRQQRELVERRRDLISYKPSDVKGLATQEKIKELDRQAQEIEAELATATEQVDTAEAEALADIANQVTTRKAELETAYQEALKTIQDFEDTHAKLDNGDWVDSVAYNELDTDLKIKLQSLGVEDFNKYITDEQAKFQAENVQLSTGEYVLRDNYNQMSAELQASLQSLGIEEFNNLIAQQQREFEASNVRLDNGDYVSKTEFNNLTPQQQSDLRYFGVAGYNKFRKDQQEAELAHIKDMILGRASASSVDLEKYDFDNDGEITATDMTAFKNLIAGHEVMIHTRVERDIAEGKIIEVLPGQWVNTQEWQTLQLTPVEQAKLQEIGDIEQFGNWLSASREVQNWKNVMLENPLMLGTIIGKETFTDEAFKEKISTILGREVTWSPGFSQWEFSQEDCKKILDELTPQEAGRLYTTFTEKEATKITPAQFGEMVGNVLVPGYYVARNWSSLSNAERAGNIILDLLVIIPATRLVSGVVRGTRLGVSIPRAAGIAVKELAIGEIRAPIDAVLHPKQLFHALTEPVEIALKSKHVPIESLEMRFNTVRIPVKEVGKAHVAMLTRDELVNLAIKGEMPRIVLESGKEITLTPVALQKAIGEAALHVAPDIRPFLEGATIGATSNRDLYLAPTLSSRFSYATSGGRIPKGAIPGALLIRDPKVIAALSKSGRTYAGTVEIEEILKAGYKLPAPSQIITTRRLDGTKLHLLVIGEPLSKTQLAKLKLIGAKDLIRDIFTPAYKTGKASEISRDLDRLAEIEEELTSLRRMPVSPRTPASPARISQLEKEYTNIAERVNRSPETGRFGIVGISEGAFIEDALYEEYASREPEQFRAFIATLPRAEQERIERVARDNRELVSLRAVVGVTRERIEIEPRTPIGTREPVEPRTTIPTRESVAPTRVMPTRATRQPIEPREILPPRVQVPPEKPPKHVKSKRLTKEQLAGAVGWKQGFMYKVIYPPYGPDDIINSKSQIEGIKYYAGIRSAYESLMQTKAGELPATIRRDMGIMDITIETKEGGKPKMRFVLDKKQRTTAPRVQEI